MESAREERNERRMKGESDGGESGSERSNRRFLKIW